MKEMSSIVIGNEMYRVEKIAPDEIQVWVGHPEGGCFEVDDIDFAGEIWKNVAKECFEH